MTTFVEYTSSDNSYATIDFEPPSLFTYQSQQFTMVGNKTVNQVSVKLYKLEDSGGDTKLFFYLSGTGSGGEPGGSNFSTGSLLPGEITATSSETAEWYTCNMTSSTLTDGSIYNLKLFVGSVDWDYRWAHNTAGTYDGGNRWERQDGSWSEKSGDDFMFAIGGDTPPTTPTTQSSNISFTASSNYATWAVDTGSGASRAVFAIKALETSSNAPAVDSVAYTSSTIFGSGSQIGSTGWYCVSTGSNITGSISGLEEETIYSLGVCEYNE